MPILAKATLKAIRLRRPEGQPWPAERSTDGRYRNELVSLSDIIMANQQK